MRGPLDPVAMPYVKPKMRGTLDPGAIPHVRPRMRGTLELVAMPPVSPSMSGTFDPAAMPHVQHSQYTICATICSDKLPALENMSGESSKKLALGNPYREQIKLHKGIHVIDPDPRDHIKEVLLSAIMVNGHLIFMLCCPSL